MQNIGNYGTRKMDTIMERIDNFVTSWQSAWMSVLKISYSIFWEILIHRKAIGAVARHPDWSVSGSYFDWFERFEIYTSSTRKKPSYSMKNTFTRSAASWGLFAKERVGTCLPAGKFGKSILLSSTYSLFTPKMMHIGVSFRRAGFFAVEWMSFFEVKTQRDQSCWGFDWWSFILYSDF